MGIAFVCGQSYLYVALMYIKNYLEVITLFFFKQEHSYVLSEEPEMIS